MNGNQSQQRQPQQQQQIKVNLQDAEDVLCEECSNAYFTPVVMIKRLSPLVSPTGQEAMVPIQLFQCNSCGNVNDHFLPEELQNTNKNK